MVANTLYCFWLCPSPFRKPFSRMFFISFLLFIAKSSEYSIKHEHCARIFSIDSLSLNSQVDWITNNPNTLLVFTSSKDGKVTCFKATFFNDPLYPQTKPFHLNALWEADLKLHSIQHTTQHRADTIQLSPVLSPERPSASDPVPPCFVGILYRYSSENSDLTKEPGAEALSQAAIVALEQETGKIVWTFPTKASYLTFFTAQRVELDGKQKLLMFLTDVDRPYILDAYTGEIVYNVTLNDQIEPTHAPLAYARSQTASLQSKSNNSLLFSSIKVVDADTILLPGKYGISVFKKAKAQSTEMRQDKDVFRLLWSYHGAIAGTYLEDPQSSSNAFSQMYASTQKEEAWRWRLFVKIIDCGNQRCVLCAGKSGWISLIYLESGTPIWNLTTHDIIPKESISSTSAIIQGVYSTLYQEKLFITGWIMSDGSEMLDFVYVFMLDIDGNVYWIKKLGILHGPASDNSYEWYAESKPVENSRNTTNSHFRGLFHQSRGYFRAKILDTLVRFAKPDKSSGDSPSPIVIITAATQQVSNLIRSKKNTNQDGDNGERNSVSLNERDYLHQDREHSFRSAVMVVSLEGKSGGMKWSSVFCTQSPKTVSPRLCKASQLSLKSSFSTLEGICQCFLEQGTMESLHKDRNQEKQSRKLENLPSSSHVTMIDLSDGRLRWTSHYDRYTKPARLLMQNLNLNRISETQTNLPEKHHSFGMDQRDFISSTRLVSMAEKDYLIGTYTGKMLRLSISSSFCSDVVDPKTLRSRAALTIAGIIGAFIFILSAFAVYWHRQHTNLLTVIKTEDSARNSLLSDSSEASGLSISSQFKGKHRSSRSFDHSIIAKHSPINE